MLAHFDFEDVFGDAVDFFDGLLSGVRHCLHGEEGFGWTVLLSLIFLAFGFPFGRILLRERRSLSTIGGVVGR